MNFPRFAVLSLRRLIASLAIGAAFFTDSSPLRADESARGADSSASLNPAVLPGTRPLTATGDIAAEMVAGIGRYLDRQLADSVNGRREPDRERFAHIIGAVDPRISDPQMELVATTAVPAQAAETDRFVAYAVRWPVLEGVHGEGLLLEPKGPVLAQVVALPDADQTPETIAGLAPGLPPERQYARRLAENGCRVLIPTLLDRSDRFSGNPDLNQFAKATHREWIYRQAYILGRHVIGYEVEKVLSAVDWLVGRDAARALPIGVAGWGEGGLLAFYSAALDPRIQATAVSGYFGPRERMWEEPIYRNVFGLLQDFGDADLARLIVPRTLMVEYAPAPKVAEPPLPAAKRDLLLGSLVPGHIATPAFPGVEAEVRRARGLAGASANAIVFLHGEGGAAIGPLADSTLSAFLQALHAGALSPPGREPAELRPGFDPVERQGRQVRELEAFSQGLIARSRAVRDGNFWKKTVPTTPEAWQAAMQPYRERMWDDLIGRLPPSHLPLNPRARQIFDQPAWTGYEVMLDVAPDVFAYGYLLLPKDLKPGERRPVVVTQHGLEGTPADVVTEDPKTQAFRYYQAFARRLAEQGFIVFAPQNPYRGGNTFRQLQRKANPLGESLFSFILAQHQRILDWLSAQPWVDPKRIAFYGLSYGGKTAMRVPALLDRYCLSICSGDFNEWVYKNAATDWTLSYAYRQEYEMPEFNLAQTFSYAEMAALIAPRPFMVERGHRDGVGDDEWIAFEYAKVKRLYDGLGLPDRTEIEYFNGPHMIHGVGTFAFLHRQLRWP